MPADAVQAIIDDMQKHARGARLSPSILNPDTHCRRQIVGERFMDYVQDPFALWDALEGTLFHWAMVEAGKNLPQWQTNVRMPQGKEVEGVKLTPMEIEVFPGVFLSGEADRIRDLPEGKFEIADHKTSRYAKQDYGPRNVPEWAIQVNIYRYMYEDLTGRKASGLWVWRTYRGSYERSRTFRKFPIPFIERSEMWEKIGPWVESLRDFLAEAVKKTSREEMEALVKTIPMDGFDKQMFGGKKCELYCGFREECFRLAGKVTF